MRYLPRALAVAVLAAGGALAARRLVGPRGGEGDGAASAEAHALERTFTGGERTIDGAAQRLAGRAGVAVEAPAAPAPEQKHVELRAAAHLPAAQLAQRMREEMDQYGSDYRAAWRRLATPEPLSQAETATLAERYPAATRVGLYARLKLALQALDEGDLGESQRIADGLRDTTSDTEQWTASEVAKVRLLNGMIWARLDDPQAAARELEQVAAQRPEADSQLSSLQGWATRTIIALEENANAERTSD